jgi:hypothetical protein
MKNRLALTIDAAAEAGRRITRDEAAGVTRWHADGERYAPVHAAEFALRGMRADRVRGRAYSRRLFLARRILSRQGLWPRPCTASERVAIDRLLGRPASCDPVGRMSEFVAADRALTVGK